MTAEATRDLPTAEGEVETPLETTRGRAACRAASSRCRCCAPASACSTPSSSSCPSAQVGYFGLERNEQTAVARRYYEKVPKDLQDAVVYLLDPMLATGGSAAMAIEGLQDLGARHVRLLCVVAAPEGVACLETAAPEAEVYTAALDRELNDRKYILPGLGDFGDRLFGT